LKHSHQIVESTVDSNENESADYGQIKELKDDLESTKQSLQTIIEVQEATNEELRSTMEEAQSSNEELQSTNEELETAKEELQSGNEELQTLNEELKNRNQALGRLNDDLANLQTNIDASVIIVDCDLKVRRFTASAQVLLKILPSHVGQPITDVKLEVNVADIEKIITDVTTNLSSVNLKVTCAGGILCEMRVRPYLTEEKKIDGAVLTFTDITERKKAEEKIEEYQKNLEKRVVERTKKLEVASLYARSLLEASLDPMVTINKGGKITDINKATEDITGCSREELIGSDFSNYFTAPEKARASYQHVFTEGLVKDYPLAMRHKSGRITSVLYNASLYRNSKGEVQGVFAAARDITELNKAEEEAHESEKRLKDSERLAAIGATAGMVGHDIRNPLQAITGDVYLAITDLASIPESSAKKEILESLKAVEKNISYIDKIVVDLQDFARPLTPNIEETDFSKMTRVVLDTLIIPENITVTCSIEKDFPLLLADKTYIQRILTNLCNNAIQAMPNGGKFAITAAVKNGKATITVQDTGDGIPEDIKTKIFTPLTTSKAKGQGFGLSVVKRFTEAMGGTVKFESEVGKETKFIVELPQRRNDN
jgi:two-component system CheB/CheR fusion protein